MKDKFLSLFDSPNAFALSFIYICISTILLFGYLLFITTSNVKTSHSNQNVPLIKSDFLELAQKINTLQVYTKNCIEKKSCDEKYKAISAEKILTLINSLNKQIASEKDYFNNVGIDLLANYEITLSKHLVTGSADALKEELEQNQPKLNEVILNLDKIDSHLSTQNIDNYKAFNYLFIFGITIFSVFSWLYLYSHICKRELLFINNDKKFQNIYSMVEDWDFNRMRIAVNSEEFDSFQKSFFSRVLDKESERINFTKQLDLYSALFNMIGYEIRNISNVILGGVAAIEKKLPQSDQTLLYKISSSSEILEGLAKNFSNMFTQVTSDSKQYFEVNTLAIRLMRSLNEKLNDTDKETELYIDPKTPPLFYGNYVGVFWMLLLQYSNAIIAEANKNLFLHIYHKSNDDIDKLTLVFDLYITNESMKTIQEYESFDWVYTNQKNITLDSLVEHLLIDISMPKMLWYEHENNSLFRVEIDLTPYSYLTHDNSLDGRQLAILGSDTLEADIVKNYFSHAGVNVDLYNSSKELLDACLAQQSYDAVLLIETKSGVDLQAISKTLKQQTNLQVLCAMEETEQAVTMREIADDVYIKPLDMNPIRARLNTQEVMNHSSAQFKALIVEDDDVQRFFLEKVLNKIGIKCDLATNGEEALNLIDSNNYFIIFMDCIMPGIDGFETTTRIRNFETEKHQKPTTIIGVTALSSEDNKIKGLESGMDYVIAKPYKKSDIGKIVQKYKAAYKEV